MRQYFELYVAFCRLDLSNDHRIDLHEFKGNLDMLHRWGVPVEEEEAEAVFNHIDSNGGGYVMFDEFCIWAITRNLDLEDDDDFEDEEFDQLAQKDRQRMTSRNLMSHVSTEILIPSKEYLRQQSRRKVTLAGSLSKVARINRRRRLLEQLFGAAPAAAPGEGVGADAQTD